MSIQEVKVPDIGGSEDVEVIELCVGPGDRIEVDDSILVLESDKATMEVPAPMAGTIKEMRVAVGDKVSEGALVLLLETETDAPPASPEAPAPASETEAEPPVAPKPAAADAVEHVVVAVPDIGSDSATVIELCVAVGDEVDVDDSLVVLESDKATMEVPSTAKGKVTKVLLNLEDKVGEGVAIVELASVAQSSASAVSETVQTAPPVTTAPSGAVIPQAASAKSAAPTEAASALDGEERRVHAGPAVRKLAREFGVELHQVTGSGPRSRILKEDVQNFVKQSLKSVGATSRGVGSGIPEVKLPDFSQFGEISRRPMSKIHKVTADNMHKAWLNVPHVTQFEEADITDLETFRKANKGLADVKGVKLTPMPFLLKACAYAIRALPQFNVSLDMDKQEVIEKSYVHIGLAVDTPSGLVVPVIRDVDKKGIWELAEETVALAQKAKDKKLMPAEMQGGCFTISSLGGLGGTAFTPIVNTPEVAILGVSKASMKPVWDGSQFAPRLMLPLSLSYDHRAINGADAARFTTLLAQLLGDIRHMLL